MKLPTAIGSAYGLNEMNATKTGWAGQREEIFIEIPRIYSSCINGDQMIEDAGDLSWGSGEEGTTPID
ncbi:hypothetical protein K2Y11_08725 [bacterium]|nr:hypothetical protein [bacterium]